MKVLFANQVIKKLEYCMGIGEPKSGYIRTQRIGKYVIVTDMILSDIKRIFDDNSLTSVYKLWGNEFGGVFFNDVPDKITPFLLEKLILQIKKKKYTFFRYDSTSRYLEKFQEGKI